MVRRHAPVLSRRSRPIVAVLLALIAIPVLAGTVLGHHPEISAIYNCDGTVTFTSTAWEGTPQPNPTASSRTNDKIEIAWSTVGLGGPFTALPANASYHFDSANSFTFTDSFNPGGASPVWLRARAIDDWGNGTAPVIPGDDRFTEVSAPTDCATPTPTATPEVTPTPTPDVTPTPEVTPTPTPDVTPTPEVTPTPTPDVTPTPRVTPTPEVTPTPGVTQTPAATPTPTGTGGVGGETGTPGVTPPSTSSVGGSSGSSGGWPFVLLALIGVAVLSLILLPDERRRTQR